MAALSPAFAIKKPGDETTALPKTPSLIQRMNEPQLNSLVGYLLELDSIPLDIVKEIEVARYRIEKQKAGLYYSFNPQIDSVNENPASDIYSFWSDKETYPLKETLQARDTTFGLKLQNEKTGTYFHPFPGVVTSEFGWRDSANHNGIDIELHRGDAVSAAFDGKVRIAKRHFSYGNFVIIRHNNGLETVYAHLSKLKVRAGDHVLAGQVIGLGGSTGRSTGNHLHFEVRFKHVPINPRYLISFEQQKLLADTVTIKRTRMGMGVIPSGLEFHEVKKGEHFFEVAKHYGLSSKEFQQLNGWNYRVRLKAGQLVRVASIAKTLPASLQVVSVQ